VRKQTQRIANTSAVNDSPATPKLILALIFPLIENTGQLPKFSYKNLAKNNS